MVSQSGDTGIERREMAGTQAFESANPVLPGAFCAVLGRNKYTQTRPGRERHLISSWGFGCKLGAALQSDELCASSVRRLARAGSLCCLV